MHEIILACNVCSYGKYRQQALEHMKTIGIRYAEVSIGKPEDTYRRLRRMGNIAADLAVKVAMETHADSVTELRKVFPHVFSVHPKDTNGRPRTWYFPTLADRTSWICPKSSACCWNQASADRSPQSWKALKAST